MHITMTNTHYFSIAQIKAFLNAPALAEFHVVNHDEAYDWIEKLLTDLKYLCLKSNDKGLVLQYIVRMTGYSESQVDRLVKKYKRFGHIRKKPYKRCVFASRFKSSDIALLAKTDNLHGRLSGPATRVILWEEYTLYHKPEYAVISTISSSHIYNLRHTRTYLIRVRRIEHTKPNKVAIGERKKPETNGEPGYLRVDTVHQGDIFKEGKWQKGLYHINVVDERLQWEVILSVEKISEQYLTPILEELMSSLPFIIRGFHTDNGSEYINKVVAKLLEKLRIKQTKSRPRHSTDNGLVETKNGSIIRKNTGYHYINPRSAFLMNQWYKDYFNIYLNYHRPCGFPTTIVDKRGKERIVYRSENYRTPYHEFKSLPNADKYLKPGVSFADLDKIAYTYSSNDFAEIMQKAKQKLSTLISKEEFNSTLTN